MPVIDGKVHRATYTSLKLRELSSVDRPAQAGAKAVIMKRDYSADERENMAEAGQAMEDGSFPIKDKADLKNAIQSIGRASDPAKARAHIIRRAKALGSTELLPEEWIKGDSKMSKTVEQLETELTALKAENAVLKTERDTAIAKADKAKADCDAAMEGEEKAKKALSEATDEVIKVEDTEVRKSEVGPAQFALTKALIDKADKATFEKRAQDEFPHLVGTSAEKGLVLKAMATMPEAAATALKSIMTAAEKMTSIGFGRIGTAYPGEQNIEKAQAESDFNGKIQEIAKRDNIPLSAAMGKARAEYPAEFAKAYPAEAAN